MSGQRVRLRLAKEDGARFIGHLDLARALERAARRANLPVALSEGFHPMPKLALGPPLALGATSRAEYLDLELTVPLSPAEVAERLASTLPPGLRLLGSGAPAPGAKALMAECAAADYRVWVVPCDAEWDGSRAVEALLGRSEWVVSRPATDGGERRIDIRPHLLALEYLGGEGRTGVLAMRVRTGSSGGARPEEFLPALGEFSRVEVERTEVLLERQGGLVPAL